MADEATSAAVRGPEVEALSPGWEALLDAHPDATPFSGPLVQLAQRAAFAPEHELLAIETRRGGELVGVVPLFARRMRAGRVGYRELGFFRGPHTLRNHLLHAPSDFDALLAACAALGGWDSLAIDNLPDDPTVISALAAAARAAGLGVDPAEPGREIMYADLGDGFDAYIAGRGRNLRWQLKSRRRNLDAAGRFEVVAFRGAESIRNALPEWEAVIAQSWQADGGATSDAEQAFRSLLAGCGTLWIARLDSRPIATLRVLERGATAYVHLMHYAQDCAPLAPGMILFDAFMRGAAEAGMRRVDFNGSTSFFARWSTGVIPHLSLRLWPAGLRGHGFRLARQGLRALNRARQATARESAPTEPPAPPAPGPTVTKG